MRKYKFILLCSYCYLSLGSATATTDYFADLTDEQLGVVRSVKEIPTQKFDKSYFSECVLKNMERAKTNSAMANIRGACEIKSIPKRCRTEDIAISNKCIDECEKENAWTKTFGSCSLG